MRFLALSAIAALACAPASAQSMMLNFSFPELRQQLTDLKTTVTKEGDTDEKTHFMEAKADTGLVFAVYGAECDSKDAGQRCRGAELVASFTLADKAKVGDALDLVDYAALADYKGADGNVKVSRYVIFDHGITQANFKSNIEVFLNLSNKVWDLLDEKGYLAD